MTAAEPFGLPNSPSAERERGQAPDLPGQGESRPLRHIAIFMYELNGGGAQRQAAGLANALTMRGYRTDLVLLSARSDFRPLLLPAVRVVFLSGEDWGWLHSRLHGLLAIRWLRIYLGIPALARYLLAARPSIMLSAASRVTVPSVMAWRLAKRPLPLALRISNHPTANFALWTPVRRVIRCWLALVARHVFSTVDAVVTNSNGVADEVAGLSGIPRRRITTIYNPVAGETLREKSRCPVDHPWFAPGGPPIVLGVSRFRIQKDLPTLIRAFALLRRVRSARLVLVGDGTQRRRLEKLVERLDLREDVSFVGYAENPFPWMARASVLVLSSAWEGLPNVIIEALACGCPVVSTDCPSGPAEILANGDFGRLVPCRDPQAMADAIQSTLESPPDPEVLRRRARFFSTEGAVDRYVALFEECLRGERARGAGAGE